ncbi:MAG TPA: hypothetical protein PK156_13295 [Polyangium sp.]|nr:hypothetical protein [Polyangium sp.]
MGNEDSQDKSVRSTTAAPIAATPGGWSKSAPASNLVNARHLNPINVWAAGIGTPLRFADSDARLPEQGGGDRVFGQDNWLIGVDFANFADLANKLGGGQLELPRFACKNWISSCGPIEENQIQRWAILAHGGPGGVDIDNTVGRDMDTSVATDGRMLNASTISKYAVQFDQLMHVLGYRAKVFFMCCLAGAGTEGDEFLKALSLRWEPKEILVVGYKSVLYCGAQNKKGSAGASCYPGARETHYSNNKQGGAPRYYETSDGWNNLSVLPWTTEATPHATIAFRGTLLKRGIDGNPWGVAPST